MRYPAYITVRVPGGRTLVSKLFKSGAKASYDQKVLRWSTAARRRCGSSSTASRASRGRRARPRLHGPAELAARRRPAGSLVAVPVTALGPSWLDPNQLIETFGLIGTLIVIFAECGLLIGFFLPGDSLLFTAGLLVADGQVQAAARLVVVLVCIAASPATRWAT